MGRKWWRAIAGVLAAGLLLTACGGSSGGTSSNGNLTWFMWSGSQAEVNAWNHVASLVTQKYPNIHVKFTTTSFTSYWTKLTSEAGSNTLPCLISLQSIRTNGYASNFVPLDSLAKQNGVKLSDFNSTILQGLTSGGSLRALPYDFGPYVIYYNTDAFQAAGLPLPAAGWTWSDFTNDLTKLSTKGKYGLAAYSGADSWTPFVVDQGGSFIKNGKVDLTGSSVQQTYSWYTSLVHEKHEAPQIPGSADSNFAVEQWQSGAAAMVVDGPWDMINDKASVKFHFGIAPLPTVNGASKTLVAGSGFGIANTCPDKNNAIKALSVMTGTTAEQYLATQGRAFAARTAQQTYWYQNAVSGSQAPLQAALQNAKPYTTTKNWQQVDQLATQYGVAALNGSESPSSVLQTVQSQAGS
ncbi:MAG: extracellular solute-binding protein [Candidatus Dormiibacterota bacterium]